MTAWDAIMSERYSHSRSKPFCGQKRVLIYHRDETSPTGVKMAEITEDYTVYDAERWILEIRNNSPLSPTEF